MIHTDDVQLAIQVGTQVALMVASAVAGWLGGKWRGARDRDKALVEGVKVTLRKDLTDSYERYCVAGDPPSIERKREIEECFDAYHRLGGNGTGSDMYRALERIEPAMIHREGAR